MSGTLLVWWFSSVGIFVTSWNHSLLPSSLFFSLLQRKIFLPVQRKIQGVALNQKYILLRCPVLIYSYLSTDKCILIILSVSGHFIDVGDDKRIYWHETKCACYELQYIYILFFDVSHKVILLIKRSAFLLFPRGACTWIYFQYGTFSHVPYTWCWLSLPEPHVVLHTLKSFL